MLVTARPQLSGLPNGSLFYLEVQNESTGSGYYQPTGAYEIALTAGPDNQDYDLYTGSGSAPARAQGSRDDAWNEPQVQTLFVGFAGEMKSIWPEGDVDWLEVEWPAGSYDNGLTFTASGPTAGADDLAVRVEFYQGDGSTYVGAWDFGGGTSAYTLPAGSVSRPTTLYVKVWWSQYEVEKSTGAYRLDVTAAP